MAHNGVSLVTGAAGFLGSHLVDRLLELGHLVFGLDNLCTGRLANLSRAMGNPRFLFFQVDVAAAVWRPPVKLEYIWHLASPASPVDYRRLSLETLLVNSLGTMNLLELAHEHRAAFLLASTSEVYGDPEVHPQPEEYRGNVSCTGERACYDEGKRFAEALTFEYRRRHGINARVVRIFNTYGPRMQAGDGRVVPNFICQALRGLPLTVYGEGRQTRSFVYVADEVEGIIRAMLYPGTDGQVFNLGNPDERSILELAGIIARLCGVELKVENRPLPPDDPRRRCPDITKARAVLGWEPKTSLEEGLKETIAYFRRLLNGGGLSG